MQPLTLEGRVVRLEPLDLAHLPDLTTAGADPDLWRWTLTRLDTPDSMRAYVETALAERAAALSLPFAIIVRATSRAIGSTRYLSLEPAHRRLEIGWTWLGRGWQRTAVNTEAKLLLLTHAFETLACQRVEFKTDALNVPSRAALERLGAVEEGTLRAHMLTAGGRVRDSVYYSIVATEWPAVKERLAERLARD
ncbi:MAG: GNAT family N-acetyltransferase [Gemmatimonadota bacterium]